MPHNSETQVNTILLYLPSRAKKLATGNNDTIYYKQAKEKSKWKIKMGSIRCKFWTSRFIISPEEFNEWFDTWIHDGFAFSEKTLPPDVKTQYAQFYHARMDINHEKENEQIPFVGYGISKTGFASNYNLLSKDFGLYPNGTLKLRLGFLELSSPAQYAVTSEDENYFTYKDILQKEPRAYAVFQKYQTLIKNITKPLYYNGKPEYSIRISNQAWTDLSQSAFIKKSGSGLSSKW